MAGLAGPFGSGANVLRRQPPGICVREAGKRVADDPYTEQPVPELARTMTGSRSGSGPGKRKLTHYGYCCKIGLSKAGKEVYMRRLLSLTLRTGGLLLAEYQRALTMRTGSSHGVPGRFAPS